MKILLISPEYPATFWDYRHALPFINKKATTPPLGLLTVAALLPPAWEKKLIDLNVTRLTDDDFAGVDYAFVGAITLQRKSAAAVVARCKARGLRVVAGGPLFSDEWASFPDVDHFVLDEAELTLPLFLEDLRRGRPRTLYRSGGWADMERSPVPAWGLAATRAYSSMNIQYSRGCSYNCEFCDITLRYGRLSRTKTTGQVIAELEALYRTGWRGAVFFVDDNFIGNRHKLKKEILPAIASWMKERRTPFSFNTQASIDISDDDELISLMAEAGFDTVFVGIETPNDASLAECSKSQNRKRDLVASIRKLQRSGLQVQGGFIVGFDSDPENIFEKQIAFIQESGIVTAMVGLLSAMKGTRLYQRLEREHRLLAAASGDNTDSTINFITRMNRETLLAGYRSVLSAIYAPKPYYERVKRFLREYRPAAGHGRAVTVNHVRAFMKSMIRLGIVGRERRYFWQLMVWTLFRNPHLFPLAATMAVYGFHYRKTFKV